MKKSIERIIRFLCEELKDRGLKISKTVVFGSHSKGNARYGSDIDVAIISDDFKGKDIFARVKMTKDAEAATIRKFMVPLDVVAMTSTEFGDRTSLVAVYARDGAVVRV